jgi:hypothetical protein
MRYFLLLLCLIAPPSPTGAAGHHPFHTSVTDMHYDPARRGFEISVRIFTDDLETALARLNNGQPVKLEKLPPAQADALLERYIRAHVSVATGPQTRKPYQYVGHETEADAEWIYLELPFAEPFRQVVMQQNVLMETFRDQVNLVNLRYGDRKKTVMYRADTPVQTIGFGEE